MHDVMDSLTRNIIYLFHVKISKSWPLFLEDSNAFHQNCFQ